MQARGQLYIPTAGKPDEPQEEFDEALAALGLQQVQDEGACGGSPDQKCYLWPCNFPTFKLWQCLQTQWRVGGMGGRTGLEYASVCAYMRDIARIKPKHWAQLFSGLQAMERAALLVWAEQSD